MSKTPSRWQQRFSEYGTPPRILDPVRSYFGGEIGLDPCTSAENPVGARRFFTKKENGLLQPWSAHRGRFAPNTVFVNPPFVDLYPWIAKCIQETIIGHRIILIASATGRQSTRDWNILYRCGQLRTRIEIEGRVAFLDADGIPQTSNNMPSVLFFLGAHEVPEVDQYFGHLGPVWPDW